MAEVRRIPKWIMLEALRNNVLNLNLEKSGEMSLGAVSVGPEDFAISTQNYEPVLKLKVSNPKTIEVGVGDTITAILLDIYNLDVPAEYDADDQAILYPIVDVDGNGETFPDGGSIDTTDFEVYLNDL